MGTRAALEYVPLYAAIRGVMPARRWRLLPGLWLETCHPAFLRVLQTSDAYRGFFPFHPNFAVRVDCERYVSGLSKRADPSLKAQIKRHHDTESGLPIEAEALARLVVISFLLCQSQVFSFSSAVTYRDRQGLRKGQLGSSARLQPHAVTEYAATALPRGLAPGKLRSAVRRRVRQLEIYFRPFCWQSDRLGVALNGFWTAVCTPYADQAFVSLMTAVEALLSTDTGEITHAVAERAALLLARRGEERLEIYKRTKRLYGVRSHLVHGSAKVQKKALTWDSTFVTAKRSNVAVSDFADLAQLVVRLIGRVLDDPKLLREIQMLRKEELATDSLRNYFRALVLNLSHR